MPAKMKLTLTRPRRPAASNSRCQPDLFNPNIKCLAKETGDDRQCVSHFFGRNKTSTASIPQEYFPMLCRKHYQERLYRWNEEPGSYAGYQCDNIIKVLERMPEKIFIDENGNNWPWWCGFELRITQAGEESTIAIPEWLVKMCSGDDVEDANAVRYNLSQLLVIVKAIKTWCIKNKCPLPRVEALPLTIGICDADALDKARRISREADSKRQAAYNELNRYDSDDSTPSAKSDELFLEFEKYEEEADLAKNTFDLASMDAAASKATIPPKRETKPRSKLNQIVDPDVDVDSPDEKTTKRPRKLGSELDMRKKSKCGE